MSDDSRFQSGPNLMRNDRKYASPDDISRLRQRMLNLEETVRQLQLEIQNLKDK